jgi:large subunit ribosomal protein L21
LEGDTIYAIVETGGKQYRVRPGLTIDVDRLEAAAGETVELDRVLLINDDKKITVGQPTVEGARVVATFQGEHKDKKVIVFKYKPKRRYTCKRGHRQIYTRLTIDKILGPGKKSAKTAKAEKAETATS